MRSKKKKKKEGVLLGDDAVTSVVDPVASANANSSVPTLSSSTLLYIVINHYSVYK